MIASSDVFDGLEAEQDRLESLLGSLDDADWARPSSCAGWSVADVVLHLAQTEENVVAAVGGGTFEPPEGISGSTVDEIVDQWVAAERGRPPSEAFERWKRARREALSALRSADPDRPVAWAAAPLKPRTLATTRLAEHWVHAHDIADPLDATYPDSDRLWHVAWLAHRTIPFAYARAGRSDPPTVHLELESPDGETWTFPPIDGDVAIKGTAAEFCRVAGRRLAPERTSLETTGPRAAEVLELVRTYA